MPVNRKKGSPRYGKKYRVGKAGEHIYNIGGKRVVIGAKKAPTDPYAPQVESTLRLKYDPAEQEIAAERRISDQQIRNTGDYWTRYQQDVARANQATQQGYSQAQQGIYSQANTARSQDAAQSAELDRAAQASAASRGTVTGPSPAAAAQAARQALSNSFGGLVGAQGAAQNAYGQSQYATAGGIRASEVGKEQARRRLVEKKSQELAREKGADRVKVRQDLADQAWKTQLEEATFGLKRQDTLSDNARLEAQNRQAAKDRAESRKLTRRGQDVTVRGQDLADARAREKAAKGGKGKARYHKGYGNTNVSLAKAVTARQQWAGILDHPTNTDKAPRGNPTLIRAAAEYHRGNGKVSKKTALKIYRTFGFRIPYGKPKKAAPRRNPKKPTTVISPW